MKNNISIIKNCYGCGVCAKACGKKIIKIRLNSEGFYEPFITNITKCNECGLCLDVCAYNSEKLANSSSYPIKSYAAWSKNIEVRRSCSSGGIGFEISKFLLNKGYKICAVKYNTENNRAEHFITNSIEELTQSKGSKYIQSYTFDALNSINKTDKYLITGTPCQIDSVRRYIQKFRLENNFILLDFFCHGVPTMLAWDKYINSVKKQIGSLTHVEWRNKDTGWHDSWCMHIKGEHNSYISKATKGDLFYQLFFRNACLNKACYSKCKYKYKNSSADIRIGDLWGNQYQNNEDGVSALIIFSEKGKEVITSLSNIQMTEHPFEIVAEGQMEHKLKEHKVPRKITLMLLKQRFFSIKAIVTVMKICLKIFK